MQRQGTVGLIVAVVLLSGCGKAGYEKDYAARLVEYRKQGALAPLDSQVSTFAGARLAMRLPKGFAPVPGADAAAADDPTAPKLDPSRSRPTFLQSFPGFVAAYERPADAAGKRLQESLAIWLVPAADRKATEIEKDVLEWARREESLADAFKGPAPTWQDAAVEPAAGGPGAWRRLELRGGQVMECDQNGLIEVRPVPGACDIWVSAQPDQEFCTVLAWRSIDNVTPGGTAVSALAGLVPRTVAILPAAADEAAPPAAE